MKTAIIITSDPNAKTDEANGRAFNAFALAQDSLRHGDQVEIVFIGAGSRWPGVVTQLGHPFNEIYNSVREAVVGVSCGCAAAFGATDSVQACGLKPVADNPVGGTPGLASVRRYLAEGWQTLVF